MTSETYEFVAGTTPVLISIPHAGTELPDALRARLTDDALELPDTDWHVHLLYDFAAELGVSMLKARYSRYVIDLNRDPEGRALYPGANNTELVPTTTFARAAIYRQGQAPSADEIARRADEFWQPYHRRLRRRRHDPDHGPARGLRDRAAAYPAVIWPA